MKQFQKNIDMASINIFHNHQKKKKQKLLLAGKKIV